ncbi:DsbA family protein [Sporolactobacillus pectinivorans]|uniref:DsbA family protein n=1 Tax=Sporolactobacillus pectinivorans TaxID=1591408 RepID=UPI000C25F915|nr:DsbA family protein [Sporolactobacillus pectinivorans]
MGKKAFLILCLALVTIAAVTAGVFSMKNGYASSTKQIKIPDSERFDLSGQPFNGKKQAKNIIIEFGDYRCPWCYKFQNEVYPSIQKNLLDTGKAKFYYINYTVLGPNSYKAANAAYYVSKKYPKSFFAFHDALFHAQQNENKNWVTDTLLIRLAKKVIPKLDIRQFKSIIKTNKYMRNVESLENNAEKIGVRGTPTLLVNDKNVNPFNYEAIKKELK